MAKMTQKEMFQEIITLAEASDRTDIVEFAKGRILAITKKSAKQSSKRDAEREALLSIIYESIGDQKVSIGMLMASDPALGTLTSQKISSLLKILVDDGKVDKVKEKKIMYYFIPDLYTPDDDDGDDSKDSFEE